jgi:hypothetical protein
MYTRQAEPLQSRLNSARPTQATKFSDLRNGQYIVSNIRAFMCSSRFGGGSFRAVRVEVLDMFGAQHSTYLPTYLARVISDEDVTNLNHGGATFEKRGTSLEWTLSDPIVLEQVEEQEILEIV